MSRSPALGQGGPDLPAWPPPSHMAAPRLGNVDVKLLWKPVLRGPRMQGKAGGQGLGTPASLRGLFYDLSGLDSFPPLLEILQCPTSAHKILESESGAQGGLRFCLTLNYKTLRRP